MQKTQKFTDNPTDTKDVGSDFAIVSKLRGDIPYVPFEEIAHDILGKKFELSLVLCADKLATRINREYRNKTYSPNVLSFPLSPTAGEIFLNVRQAEREAHKYNIPVDERITFLYIHGCLHVGGLDHGDAMEHAEKKFMKKQGLSTDLYASNDA